MTTERRGKKYSLGITLLYRSDSHVFHQLLYFVFTGLGTLVEFYRYIEPMSAKLSNLVLIFIGASLANSYRLLQQLFQSRVNGF